MNPRERHHLDRVSRRTELVKSKGRRKVDLDSNISSQHATTPEVVNQRVDCPPEKRIAQLPCHASTVAQAGSDRQKHLEAPGTCSHEPLEEMLVERDAALEDARDVELVLRANLLPGQLGGKEHLWLLHRQIELVDAHDLGLLYRPGPGMLHAAKSRWLVDPVDIHGADTSVLGYRVLQDDQPGTGCRESIQRPDNTRIFTFDDDVDVSGQAEQMLEPGGGQQCLHAHPSSQGEGQPFLREGIAERPENVKAYTIDDAESSAHNGYYTPLPADRSALGFNPRDLVILFREQG
jgi:hypothetical protein